MIVGIQVWELHLPGCHSLKEKRGTLKPLTAALRQRLNVSVAETGNQDLWQRAEIACAAVGSARALSTHSVPELHFELDKGLAHAARINELLEEIRREETD